MSDFPILSWKRIKIDGVELPYIISDKGIVINDVNGEFMLITPDKDNYPVVKLKINGDEKVFKVHRLCAEAFLDNPFRLPEVDHINRNHWDASKDNLEFVTGEENIRRLVKLREIEKNHLCNYKNVAKNRLKYTELQIIQVCIRLSRNESIREISRKTAVDMKTIYMIHKGEIWKNISCYFSFNNDGIFNSEDINTIIKYINKGFTNKSILSMLNITEYEYFDDFINKLRKSVS